MGTIPNHRQRPSKMRLKTFVYPLLFAPFFVSAALPNQKLLSNPHANPNLGPAMPSPPTSSSPGASTGGSGSDSVILSDVLGNDRSINIFAGFTRDFATISQRFEDSNTNTTILAPINSAIMALPRKPWEDPKDYEGLGADAYEGKEGVKVKTLEGSEVWWEAKDGVKFIQPGNIEVSSVASKVYNGEVWILKGVRNYA